MTMFYLLNVCIICLQSQEINLGRLWSFSGKKTKLSKERDTRVSACEKDIVFQSGPSGGQLTLIWQEMMGKIGSELNLPSRSFVRMVEHKTV